MVCPCLLLQPPNNNAMGSHPSQVPPPPPSPAFPEAAWPLQMVSLGCPHPPSGRNPWVSVIGSGLTAYFGA